MATSRLNASFVYPENRGIFADDEEHETELYELTVHGVPIVFGLGNPKRYGTLVFFPMYLVCDSELHSQIGVFEVPFDQVSTIYDDDGELLISRFGRPLLYPYACRRYLQCVGVSGDLCEQSAAMSKDERASYKRATNDPWICQFLSSPFYDLLPSRGSWFDVLSDAFEGTLTADQLRVLYAESIPEELYTEDMLRHKRSTAAYALLTTELKQFLKEHERLKERIRSARDRNSQMEVVRLAERIAAQHKRTVAERQYHKRLLHKPFDKVTSLAEYRAVLRTDPPAHIHVRVLEAALRTQVLVFSKDHYDAKQTAQVLRFECGAEPKRFAMVGLERKGERMALITYKGHRLVPFASLPHGIKLRMAHRCAEGAPTNVMLLRQFMRERHMAPPPTVTSKWCDPRTRLLLSVDACDGVLPGKEFGEVVETPLVELSLIPQWRRKLANEWLSPFELDGRRWASVEHFIQGSKFEGDLRALFSLDSNSVVSQDVGRARQLAQEHHAAAHKRSTQEHSTQEHKPDVRLAIAEEQAIEAKLAQKPDLVELLRHTGDALLLYYREGVPPVPATAWMKLRRRL